MHLKSIRGVGLDLDRGRRVFDTLLLVRITHSRPGTCATICDLPTHPTRAPNAQGTRWVVLLAVPDRTTLKGKRDYVIIALLVS